MSRRQARRTVDRLQFGPMEVDTLVEAARPLSEGRGGWLTLVPVVPPEEEPARPLGPIASMVASARHDVPVATWVPGTTGRRGRRPDALGVQHSTGGGAANRLEDEGVTVPDGWRVVQDHPRRGLVVEPPLGTPVDSMLPWLVRAGAVLCRVRFSGRWRAELHRRH